MAHSPQEGQLPPSLRILQALVILLMLSMIGGVIAVVWLLVTRLPAPEVSQSLPALPAAVVLPEGEIPAALTFGKGWVAVVTESDRILIYGQDGRLKQDVKVTP